ncbi:Txe/YoeB family addiction module toxin [Rhodoferax sp. 4810]|uniref:Putative mRNA interferase YoeB n=1 Tax=Thiospirillum jenense TaxID=1653858 RepID=A0A839HHM2_9GAMM|nr:Txe/YoeB family addiction module toxin [Thiospirillum jenense]MBB1077966.1 Txe/YoeB family addiction module toxin [Rhodoferax jenense]MBB1127390.1 Txe/YoeB family addiction module toxin [Thiospirillum jenense]
MLRLTWTETALEDLSWWQQHDAKMLKKIIQLCLDACSHPTQGLGKPEALKHDFQGYWSRRINQEHRLVYAFDNTHVTIIQCRFHYKA